MSSKYLLILFLFSSSVLCEKEYRDINLIQGPIRGYEGDGNHFVFYGIPYATAPVGVNKFKAPLPAPTWSTRFEAVNQNIVCPQKENNTLSRFITNEFKITEDCLVANVYVPKTNKVNLPVLVVVNGKAYQFGYGELIKSGDIVDIGEIVVVTFNYRVGIHGFLCLGTETAPGNAGLKDMVALLKWVNTNIAAFNGNPNDVTLAGYSSGSAAVELLLLSKSSNRLFKKVIVDSGNSLSPWGVSMDPIETAKNFALSRGISIDQLETYFTTTPIEQLQSEAKFILKNSSIEFAPCIERDVGQERFLSNSPMNILRSGDFPKLPLLIGHTKYESLFRFPFFEEWATQMDKSFIDFVPADLQFSSIAEKKQIAEELMFEYFGDEKASINPIAFIEYFSDAMFKYPIYRSVRMHVEAGSRNVYFYEYGLYDPSAFTTAVVPQSMLIKGPGHMAQTYLFYGMEMDESKYSETLKKTQAELRRTWINFIKTGRPRLNRSEWPPVSSPEGTPILSINKATEVQYYNVINEVNVWDRLYEKYYRQPVPASGI